ncbi:hypothetical protein NA57DRAFT_54503 [Rhizodiscina lignyota]|uniref:Uncharacterized protein n=1 Tax=Rhizodiscina lignyota TaxID=1504668 RepID=A0A9P4II48_9PEZI|nr:hypothetical protein NA57DRAFT_54503 [Rhizodiscina lignyota]
MAESALRKRKRTQSSAGINQYTHWSIFDIVDRLHKQVDVTRINAEKNHLDVEAELSRFETQIEGAINWMQADLARAREERATVRKKEHDDDWFIRSVEPCGPELEHVEEVVRTETTYLSGSSLQGNVFAMERVPVAARMVLAITVPVANGASLADYHVVALNGAEILSTGFSECYSDQYQMSLWNSVPASQRMF